MINHVLIAQHKKINKTIATLLMLDVELFIDNTYSMHMEIMNAINTVRYWLYLWSGIWVIELL